MRISWSEKNVLPSYPWKIAICRYLVLYPVQETVIINCQYTWTYFIYRVEQICGPWWFSITRIDRWPHSRVRTPKSLFFWCSYCEDFVYETYIYYFTYNRDFMPGGSIYSLIHGRTIGTVSLRDEDTRNRAWWDKRGFSTWRSRKY